MAMTLRPLLLLTFVVAVALSACGDSASQKAEATQAREAAQAAQDAAQQKETAKAAAIEEARNRVAKKRNGMQTPEWAPYDSLPPEWGGLYAKDCIIGGPEDSYFFTVRNSKTNTRYEFIHITYPPSLNKKPKTEVTHYPPKSGRTKIILIIIFYIVPRASDRSSSKTAGRVACIRRSTVKNGI